MSQYYLHYYRILGLNGVTARFLFYCYFWSIAPIFDLSTLLLLYILLHLHMYIHYYSHSIHNIWVLFRGLIGWYGIEIDFFCTVRTSSQKFMGKNLNVATHTWAIKTYFLWTKCICLQKINGLLSYLWWPDITQARIGFWDYLFEAGKIIKHI